MTDEDLSDYVKDQFPEGIEVEPVSCGEFTGVGVDYVVDENFWRKQLVWKGGLLLFVTYNSDSQEQTVERAEINQMLATLKARWPAA